MVKIEQSVTNKKYMPRKSIEKTQEKKVLAEKAAVKKEKAVKKTAKVTAPKVEAKVTAAKEVAEKTKAPKKNSPKRDTGSVDFQIANFTEKITTLAKHLKKHAHDFDSRRGLLIMVGKRRRLLNYVKKSDPVKYEKLAQTLKVKK